jgi:hypothetical protein
MNRFIQLQPILQRDYSVLIDLSRVEGRINPEGDFLLIPLIKVSDGSDSGYAIISQEKWAIGIVQTDAPPEGYLVEGGDGTDTLKLSPILLAKDVHPDGETDSVSRASVGGGVRTQSSMSCQYASYIGLNLGCVDLSSNPLGYYYKWTTRIGYGDPSQPQWWACVWGSIHVCPQYEYGYYSPVVVSLCGFAPHHSAGG